MLKAIAILTAAAGLLFSANFIPEDFTKLRSVGTVQFSPDGSRIAYTVTRNDGPRGPSASFGS